MNARQIDDLVKRQVGESWDATNAHGVDLRQAIQPAEPITIVERSVSGGAAHDRLIDVWLVLVEVPFSRAGYRIVAAKDGSRFGLASEGLAADAHLVLCGWHGDFMTALRAM